MDGEYDWLSNYIEKFIYQNVTLTRKKNNGP